MATQLLTNFAIEAKHEAFYTGGKVQFSADGSTMFCQCGTSVTVLDVSTGRQVSTIQTAEDTEVTSFVLSPDDSMLIIAGRSLLLQQWNWVEKTVQRTWKALHVVSCMSFDVTSTLLATGGSDSTTKVWDTVRQYCTHNLKGHQGVISCVEFHPDSDRLQLLTAADDYSIRVWDLASSTCLTEMLGHYSVVTCIRFSPDGGTLYSGGRDNVVNVWDLVGFKKTKSIPVYESVEGLILLPQQNFPKLNVIKCSQHFITAGSKGVLRVWNADSATSVYTDAGVASDSPSAIVDVSCTKQSDCVNVVTFDHNIQIYQLGDLSMQKQFTGNNDDVLDATFVGPDDSHVAVATNSHQIKVFSVTGWACQLVYGHTATVLSLAASPRMALLASSSKDSTIRLWKIEEDCAHTRCVAIASGHTNAVTTVAFSKAKGRFVVSGSEDLTIKVWPIPDDIEATSDEPKVLSSLITEKAHDKDINCVTVSPNDKLIASGSQDRTAKLWSVDTLALSGVFRGHKRGIWCTQFSPVDQCLATSSADGTVKIWSLSDCTCVKTFEGHQSSVLRVLFLTQGMQLLTCGSDGLLKLWSIKSCECLRTLDAHENKIWALAANARQNLFITGAEDANIILWKDVTEEEVQESKQKLDEQVIKEQKLSNLLHQKKYLKAIGLAITLEQPLKVLSIMTDILDGEDGEKSLSETLSKLRSYQIDSVLRFVARWNTNSRHCRVAQTVLSMILTSHTPSQLSALPSVRDSLEALLPYTERHFERMNRLLQQSMFVDYTWQCMRLTEVNGMDVGDDEITDEAVKQLNTKHVHVKDEEKMEVDDEKEELKDYDDDVGGSETEPVEAKAKDNSDADNDADDDGDADDDDDAIDTIDTAVKLNDTECKSTSSGPIVSQSVSAVGKSDDVIVKQLKKHKSDIAQKNEFKAKHTLSPASALTLSRNEKCNSRKKPQVKRLRRQACVLDMSNVENVCDNVKKSPSSGVQKMRKQKSVKETTRSKTMKHKRKQGKSALKR